MNKSVYNNAELCELKVGIAEKTPTHDILFTSNIGDKLGLILANRQGMNDSKGISIAAMPRTAMRTAQGGTGYDDMELPFTTEVQETWIGGRAQETFSNDRTRFFDSYRIDTTKQYPICAPAVISQTGIMSSGDINNNTGLAATILNSVRRSILFQFQIKNESVFSAFSIRYKLPFGGILYYSIIESESSEPPTATSYDTVSELQYSANLPNSEEFSDYKIYFPATTIHATKYISIIFHIVENSNIDALPNPFILCTKAYENAKQYIIVDSDWAAGVVDGHLPYGTLYATTDYSIKFFEYKRQLYCILNGLDKNSSALYMNGYRGAADSNLNNKDKLIDGTAKWENNELANCIVLITNGAGEQEDQPWRKIISNDSISMTVSTPWKITHTTTTEYVILGTNVWTAMANHGLTKEVTDIAILAATGKDADDKNREYVMFAQGSTPTIDAPCRFMREYNNAGTWTIEYCSHAANQWKESDNGQNAEIYADYLEVGELETGETVVWRARADDSKVDYSYIGVWDATSGNSWKGQAMLYFDINRNLRDDIRIIRARIEEDYVDEKAKKDDEEDILYLNSIISQMEDATWQIDYTATAVVGDSAGSYDYDLTAGRTAHKFLPYYITCGSPHSNITNMVLYGTPRIPYIMKEDSIGSIYNNIYQTIPITELASVRSEINGKAAMQYGVYLYFNLEGGKIERYYDMRLDDVGMTRDEGMPINRQGEISKLIPYPGRYYASIDAGFTGYSSVMCSNELGWHEIYRAETKGDRITDIYVQAIPGDDYVDRLWISEGNDLKSLPIAISPLAQERYSYFGYGTWTSGSIGYIDTSWIDFGLKDVNKYFHSITIFSDYSKEIRTGQEYKIMVWFKVDGDKNWTDAGFTRAEISKELLLQYKNRFDSGIHNVSGKKIKFRIAMKPESNPYCTPRLKAIVINGILRMPVKRSWNITFHLEPIKNLQDKPLTDSPGLIYNKLFEWANSTTHNSPLLMNTNDVISDNKYVFIDPASISTFQALEIMGDGSAQKEYRHIGQMTIYEV